MRITPKFRAQVDEITGLIDRMHAPDVTVRERERLLAQATQMRANAIRELKADQEELIQFTDAERVPVRRRPARAPRLDHDEELTSVVGWQDAW